VVEEFLTRLERCDRAGIARAVRSVGTREAVEHEIHAIAVPALVAVGAEDMSTRPNQARQLAKLIPHARLEIIPGAGHSSTVEQPAAVTALLTEFLEGVEQCRAGRSNGDASMPGDLFSPLRLRSGLTLGNRIAKAAMEEGPVTGSCPTNGCCRCTGAGVLGARGC
jgi:hypothetical protein